ncbi:hypothetical protein FS837_009090 [Tulasnella sp. UAMH 9824]|nr:hypothetical protein FS837_009090 [Tulasnella sp. UAMH 9824]
MINPGLASHAEPSVHLLSYDELHSIFTLCWKPGDNTFPLIASQVCRWWRWCIFDMPVFWGHIRFHHKEPRRSMERYAAWIQRSKGVQLDISINNKPFLEFPVENIEAIMELIGPHMERWRSLQIDQVSFDNICMCLDHLKDCSLPQLELFRVVESSKGILPYCPTESLGQLVLDAPQLKEVELVGVEADFDSPLFHNLHALLLEHEGFTWISTAQAKNLIHRLLRQSPRLERLSIRNPRVFPLSLRRYYPPPVNEELFSHPSLLNLRLDFLNPVNVIIHSIRLPSLRSFRYGWMDRITLRSPHFPFLIRNSPFPSLERIRLSGDREDRQHDHHLADALATLPSLVQLELEYFDTPQVSDVLLALGHSCPQLQALIIAGCTGVDLNQARSLIDMRLGAHGITELQTLRIFGGIGEPSTTELEATKAWFEERVKNVTLDTNSSRL